MRLISLLILLLALPGLTLASSLSQSEQLALCQAATRVSALGPKVDALLKQHKLNYKQTGQLLSLDCGQGHFLLGEMVNKLRSENLEYTVIDMGTDVDAPIVTHDGKHFSVSAYLRQVAAHKGTAQARFAAGYLHDFHDPAFNPNLVTRVTMN